MRIFNILKTVLIVLFFVLLAGKYFDLFENYQLTDTLTLLDMRHVLVALYILVRIIEYFTLKKKQV